MCDDQAHQMLAADGCWLPVASGGKLAAVCESWQLLFLVTGGVGSSRTVVSPRTGPGLGPTVSWASVLPYIRHHVTRENVFMYVCIIIQNYWNIFIFNMIFIRCDALKSITFILNLLLY